MTLDDSSLRSWRYRGVSELEIPRRRPTWSSRPLATVPDAPAAADGCWPAPRHWRFIFAACHDGSALNLLVCAAAAYHVVASWRPAGLVASAGAPLPETMTAITLAANPASASSLYPLRDEDYDMRAPADRCSCRQSGTQVAAHQQYGDPLTAAIPIRRRSLLPLPHDRSSTTDARMAWGARSLFGERETA